jgi:TP901 family phage tail tape measure protein
MATQLEKLMFSISLMDRVSGPAGKIQSKLGRLGEVAKSSFTGMAGGAAGMVSAGYALKAMAGPAQDFNLAIGDVRSLDVAQNSLDILSDKAIAFSIKYGESAAGFVRSSYDIQSAIAGLADNELADFTYAGNVLAKATKANADVITDYMGTMYGIFQTTANKMGKTQWVEQLTGQTAAAVQMFKTTGAEMARAFSTLGASATASGVGQSEQMAVLGQLQATMSGSEAGTKYTAFLTGVGKAQDALGLKFTDSSGNMLGMVDILSKLQGKFGDTLDVAESDALKSAFGSDEAVKLIKQLLPQTDSLAENIGKINKTTGMGKAADMAARRVDVFARWSEGINAVRIGLGQALLPVLTPTVEKLTQGAGKIYEWTQRFPGLTKVVGGGVAVIAGGAGVIGAFAAMSGMARLAMFGLGKQSIFTKTVMLAFRLAVKATTLTMVFFKKAGLVAGKVAMLAWNLAVKAATVTMSVFRFAGLVAGKAAMLAWNLAVKAATLTMVFFKKAGLVAGKVAMLAWNLAVKAATVTMALFRFAGLVAGKAAMLAWNLAVKAATLTMVFFKKAGLVAGKVAMLAWNLAVKAATVTMALFRGGLVAARTAMLAMNAAMYANPVGLVVAGVLLLTAGVAAAIYYWDDLKAAFMDSAWGQAIIGVVDKVLGSLKSLWEMITRILDKIPSISGAWGWIKGKIPGMGEDMAVAPASSPSLDAPRQGAAVNGGVGKMISNAVNNDNRRAESRSVHIGQVVTSRPINPQEIGNQLWMAGG